MTTFRRSATMLACATAALAAAAAGCGTPRPPARPHIRTASLTSSQVSALRGYGAGDTAFGLSLMSTLCRGNQGGNVVLSPVSLETGLGMAYLGARGATAAAMAKALHLPAGGRSLVAGLRARSALLASLNRPGVTFTASNRVWADPSLPTNAGYLAALRAGYQAGLTHLPLLSQPEQARKAINSAVAAQTRGHIKDLIPPGVIAPQAIGWVLTDALYLDAAWRKPFDHSLTQPGPFTTAGGKVTVSYLNGEGFALARSAGWTAVSLPYRGSRLSMLALLPPPGGRAGACQVPAPAQIGALTTGLAASRVPAAVSLPKVSLAWHDSLQRPLAALGMGLAFGPKADFTGISPQAGSIGFVEHAATLAVAEKGTVASAATAVGVQPAAAPAVSVTFDRPYLLVLRDSLTGEPLMLAWVANPARP